MTQVSSNPAHLRWIIAFDRAQHGSALVLALRGRLGGSTAPRFTEVLVDAISAGERHVILDLAGVDYVSSAGLIALEAIAGRMAVSGGSLVVCGLTEPVRLVFELSGVLPHLTVEADRASALEHVGPSA